MLIYFDSVVVIYLLDHTGTFHARALSRLATLLAAGDQIAVGDLTRLECRVRPLRNNDAAKLAAYDGFFARPDVRLVATPSAVFDRATVVRAAHNFKTIDSLHLAAAAEGGCDRFLTNDTRLNRFTDLSVEVLP